MDIATLLYEGLKVTGTGVIGFVVGRASKNREFMQADLVVVTKEYRERIGSICDVAIRYWDCDQSPAEFQIGVQLVRDLHNAQRLRVHSAQVSVAYRSRYFRDLEDLFFDVVTGGSFQSKARLRDPARIERIRYVTDDISFAAMEARRADLFLIPYAKWRDYLHRFREWFDLDLR